MHLPDQFVYLNEIDPNIVLDMKYYTDDNFLGRPIKGYEAPVCIVTKKAALALSEIQKKLKPHALGLKVFDCYRPQMAVDDFIVWSEDDKDQKMKSDYYPNVNKRDFFDLGYLGKKSDHTRGSTVDLTIIYLDSGKEMDMGTRFDFMDELSHPLNKALPESIQKNRMLLRELMHASGFRSIETEWWHFSLENDPFPSTYFNFPVK